MFTIIHVPDDYKRFYSMIDLDNLDIYDDEFYQRLNDLAIENMGSLKDIDNKDIRKILEEIVSIHVKYAKAGVCFGQYFF